MLLLLDKEKMFVTERIEILRKISQNYAILNGLIFKCEDSFNTPPFTLNPTKVSKKSFEKVKNLMTPMNHLRDLVSRDYPFLKEHLQEFVYF